MAEQSVDLGRGDSGTQPEEWMGLFFALMDVLPDAVVFKDAEGRYVHVNRVVAQRLGLSSPAAAAGRTDLELHGGERARLAREDETEAIATGRPVLGRHEKEAWPDGSESWVAVTTLPVYDAGRRLLGTLRVSRDTTAHRTTEKERDRIFNMLQTQKNESLGVLAGGIAHDFNNLLMGVLGNIDLALLELPSTSPVRDFLHDAAKSGRRAADLCRQMLAYAGKGRFVLQTVDLRELVGEMKHILELSISKKTVLQYDFADQVPAVEVDAAQIRQVLMNLVLNASEAIGDRGGIVSIAVGAKKCDAAHLASSCGHEDPRHGTYAFLEVRDTGCGMDEDTKARMFEPFFTRKFMGRGLGLSAVQGIVRSHRGAIEVRSEPGAGATLRVLLPATDLAGERRATGMETAGRTGAGIILFADDEEAARVVGARMLGRMGYRVIMAADGAEAVDLFRQAETLRGERLVCVILDLTMPRMDGEEAFREIRRIRADVPVILSSGYDEKDVTERFAGKGLSGFVQKPYEVKDLAARLQGVLGT
jgi:PAS domain S-box-containing protein